MKIKSGFLLRPMADAFVVVPIGDTAVDFNGIISLNDTGAFLWKLMEDDTDKKTLLKKITDEYDIDADTAMTHIDKFIQKIKDADLLGK